MRRNKELVSKNNTGTSHQDNTHGAEFYPPEKQLYRQRLGMGPRSGTTSTWAADLPSTTAGFQINNSAGPTTGSGSDSCSLLVSLPLMVPYGGITKQDASSASAVYVFPEVFPSAKALFARSLVREKAGRYRRVHGKVLFRLLFFYQEVCDMFVGQLQVDLVSFCCRKGQVPQVASVFTRMARKKLNVRFPRPIYIRCEGLKQKAVAATGVAAALSGGSSGSQRQSSAAECSNHDDTSGLSVLQGQDQPAPSHSSVVSLPAQQQQQQQHVYFTAVDVLTEDDREKFWLLESFVETYVEKLKELKLVNAKTVARTSDLFVVVRRFLNDPPPQPLSYYTQFVCEGVQLSELRLVFSKGTSQCPVKHLKIDPRFRNHEISCRPIVCDSEGRPARQEFAQTTLPYIFSTPGAAESYATQTGWTMTYCQKRPGRSVDVNAPIQQRSSRNRVRNFGERRQTHPQGMIGTRPLCTDSDEIAMSTRAVSSVNPCLCYFGPRASSLHEPSSLPSRSGRVTKGSSGAKLCDCSAPISESQSSSLCCHTPVESQRRFPQNCFQISGSVRGVLQQRQNGTGRSGFYLGFDGASRQDSPSGQKKHQLASANGLKGSEEEEIEESLSNSALRFFLLAKENQCFVPNSPGASQLVADTATQEYCLSFSTEKVQQLVSQSKQQHQLGGLSTGTTLDSLGSVGHQTLKNYNSTATLSADPIMCVQHSLSFL